MVMHEPPCHADDDVLVMAMPRRELYGIQGFDQDVSMVVLESLAEESWFAEAATVLDDPEAKIVRLGLVIEREDQLLVHEDGAAIHCCAIPPEVSRLAPGLGGIRRLAARAAERMMGVEGLVPVLIGYVNDDAFVELRPFFLLVYRLVMKPETAPPPQHSWVNHRHLSHCPLDAASTMVCHVLYT